MPANGILGFPNAPKITASGGTVKDQSPAGIFDGYRYHSFTTTGASTFTVQSASRGAVLEMLIVGGGGGGGDNVGGGGAGGQVVQMAVVDPAVGSWSVVVGVGGTCTTSTGWVTANMGGPSSVTDPAGGRTGAQGGISGGTWIGVHYRGTLYSTTALAQMWNAYGAGGWNGGAYGPGVCQGGYDGGSSYDAATSTGFGGGGGGGSGGAGATATASTGGKGGAGVLVWGSYYGAGGGGGGAYDRGGGGTGGSGVGGNGGTTNATAPTPGKANTGSGGGGAAWSYIYSTPVGGTGVVIIRYKVA